MLYFCVLFLYFCDFCYTVHQTECSTSTDGGSHCYANCTPTALRYYGTCNYTPFCNYVALSTNYTCTPSYVILTNGSYSYYVAGIYVNNGIGYLQTGTCQYCNSVAVGGELDNDCFESEIGGPWTNAQKRSALEEEDEEITSHFIRDSNSIRSVTSENLISEDLKNKPRSNSVQIRSDYLVEKDSTNDALCNLLGLCDPSWHCRLAGSSLSYPINLTSCCFALINLNLQCACSPIAAALGFYPPAPEGFLGFICLP